MTKIYNSTCEHCGRSDKPIASTLQGCFCHECLEILSYDFWAAQILLEELAESEPQECAEACYPATSELAAAEIDPNGSKYTLMWE